ncbi:acidic leucine-rich nuclear phospho 32-related [Olea europaea subsp. europaea]|uniref:Acidic leucine-rich nuclear phospho 32-related n=1 Tax=Olea europaea subsp. europaea TaxID=158383 RepID=A0A8S0UVA3_OLEEU|nr:acidic leucine-rich nuclear phospho 32-related [Olea europaea subsp. europaea]
MDEIWERAVETALDGENDVASVRTLTLDGAAKCVHGRLPPPSIFEKFSNLQHLSIANIGLSSLEQFPRLRNLQKLVLSDNRISGGLEFLVEAGLEFLLDLDLSNNRISDVNDLRPLAQLRLMSLDLYECPVTRVKDYRSRAFELIGSLKYLDNMDAEGNERPESDDDEEDSDDEEEDDAGSGEIEGENRSFSLSNEYLTRNDGVIDVDEDEESDADEEVTETSRGINGLSGASNSHHLSNGFRVEDEGDESEEDDDESVEEIYEEDEGEDDDVLEVHEIDDSSDKEDGVAEDDEELDNDDGDFEEPDSNGRLIGMEGEIDGHEQGEEDNGEMGGEDLDDEEDGDFADDDEEEDYGAGYLIQPVGQIQVDADDSHLDQGKEGTDKEEDISDEDDEDGSVQELPTSSRKRNRDEDIDNGEDEEEKKKHK